MGSLIGSDGKKEYIWAPCYGLDVNYIYTTLDLKKFSVEVILLLVHNCSTNFTKHGQLTIKTLKSNII